MSENPLLSLFGPIYGSLYFAVVMATGFYGVTCMQTFFYYIHYQRDLWWIKILVAALWALNTIHEGLIISGSYKYFLAGWLNIYSILMPNPELILLLTVLVAVPTQGFFVHRLYIFSGKNLIAPVIWVALAIVQIATALIYVIKALYSVNGGVHAVTAIEINENSFMTLATLCLAASAAVDILIAIFLTLLLVRRRSATTFASTANTLQRLTVFAVNTGIWPAIFALLTLILVNVFPLNLLYAVFGIPLCSVYCNTLLANLNARSYARGDSTMHSVDGESLKSSSLPVFNSSKTDKQHEVVGVVHSTHQENWNTAEVVQFPEGNPSTSLDNA